MATAADRQWTLLPSAVAYLAHYYHITSDSFFLSERVGCRLALLCGKHPLASVIAQCVADALSDICKHMVSLLFSE